jgi:Lon protease-like protein
VGRRSFLFSFFECALINGTLFASLASITPFFPIAPFYRAALRFPRYRLMLRRCLESEHPCFGMIMPQRAAPTGVAGPGGNNEYGTMLEIRAVQMLSDGRSMVETWGTHRFRILERGTLDGYMVGRVERVDDYEDELDDETLLDALTLTDAVDAPLLSSGGRTPPRPRRSTPPRSGLATVASTARSLATGRSRVPHRALALTNLQLMETCLSFLEQLREGTAPWVVQRLNNAYGPMPTDPASFSFWMALVS